MLYSAEWEDFFFHSVIVNYATESVPTWRTLCELLLDLGEMPLPRLIVIPIRAKRSEVFPLGGLYVSFYLIWGKCRRRETLLSIEIQNGKEGLLKN